MNPAKETARGIDHFVVPTESLATARARLGMLGFTVAPQGTHPFGTANCCVYLADGTFVEPLARADPGRYAAAAGEGNVFVARDAAFRDMHGPEGFSAIVLGSTDAAADHRRFAAAGHSAGSQLYFERPFVGADGKADFAAFRLAFAGLVADGPEFAFTCERVRVPAVDRKALEAHRNGVRRVLGATLVGADPEALATRLAAIGEASVAGGGEARRVDLGNGRITVTTPAAFEGALGLAPAAGRLMAAIRFGVSDIAAVRSILAAGPVDAAATANRIVVPPAPGQGAVFIFEETK